MLYTQEVEKLEGYGHESYQAKVSLVRNGNKDLNGAEKSWKLIFSK